MKPLIFMVACLAGGLEVPLTVPPALEAQRAQLEADVLRGREIMREFAARNGWRREGQVKTFDSVEVVDDQKKLWRRVLELNRMPLDTPLTVKGLVAGVEGRVLVALDPAGYARVVPQYARTPESWPRLIAHELVHRLHVEILQHDEEAMGPLWFFEGFACHGAGQAIDEGLAYGSAREALAATRGKPSYSRFLAAFKYFARRTSVPRLVARAGRSDFERWLLSL